MTKDIYEIGQQPCHILKRQMDGNEHGGWQNVHQCPICWGRRSFCQTCNRDHHEGGWETCTPEAYKHMAWPR